MFRKFLCCIIILSVISVPCAFAEQVRKIKTIDCTPLYKGVDFNFEAEGHEVLFIQYKSSQESGQFVLRGENGHFSGHLDMPRTYNGSNVFITVSTMKQSILIEKYNTRTLIPCPEPAEKQEGRLSGITVCIDPGHSANCPTNSEPKGPGLSGYKKQGTGMAQGILTRRMESVVNLEIAFVLRDELLRQGADVIMTRTDEEACVSNMERCRIAEEGNADIMLRIHCNAVENRNKTGIVVYFPRNSEYAKALAPIEEYRLWADTLLEAVHTAANVTNGTSSATDEYTGNNWAKMPCFLLELGYMTTPSEDLLLSEEWYQQTLAEGIAEGVYRVCQLRGLVE